MTITACVRQREYRSVNIFIMAVTMMVIELDHTVRGGEH